MAQLLGARQRSVTLEDAGKAAEKDAKKKKTEASSGEARGSDEGVPAEAAEPAEKKQERKARRQQRDKGDSGKGGAKVKNSDKETEVVDVARTAASSSSIKQTVEAVSNLTLATAHELRMLKAAVITTMLMPKNKDTTERIYKETRATGANFFENMKELKTETERTQFGVVHTHKFVTLLETVRDLVKENKLENATEEDKEVAVGIDKFLATLEQADFRAMRLAEQVTHFRMMTSHDPTVYKMEVTIVPGTDLFILWMRLKRWMERQLKAVPKAGPAPKPNTVRQVERLVSQARPGREREDA
eukprot:TRINITY_DN4368_c0_g2_i1.p2 TRINITY_DN4368_c0_g2~~TRINITY_DN4368_c0_g2_i1.p2  ORF type:complete len:302 (-),score=97.23 TRINITY_DN4368_c0_g2_i1:478-1383(-)